MSIKTVANIQVSKEHFIRVEEHEDGDVDLTLFHQTAPNAFYFLTSLLIPKKQRQNLADLLCLKPNSLTLTPSTSKKG